MTMQCEQCQESLIDHAHDELEAGARVEVSRHLAACSSCALEYCRLRADLEGIVEAVAEAPRPEVRAALMQRVERELAPPAPKWWARARRAWTRPVPVYGAVAAMLAPFALGLGLGWWALGRPRASERPRPAAAADHRPPRIPDYDATTLVVAEDDLL